MKTKIKLLLSIGSTALLSVFVFLHYFIPQNEQNPLNQLSISHSVDLTKSPYFDISIYAVIMFFLVFNIYLWTRKKRKCTSKDNKKEFDFFKTNNNEKEINHE